MLKLQKKNKIKSFRGENNNVLKRMLSSLKNKKVDHIVRITGDDILIDPDYLDIAIRSHLRTNSDYTDHKNLPSGTETEIFSLNLLKNIMLTSFHQKILNILQIMLLITKMSIYVIQHLSSTAIKKKLDLQLTHKKISKKYQLF